MEIIERLPLRPIHFLNSIPFNEFKQDCIDDAVANKKAKPKLSDVKSWFNTLKQFCKCNIKTKGITTRIYSYSAKSPAGLGGRLFSGGSSQGIWGKYRGLLMRGITTDIDMANAHPVILRFICKKHDIECPQLEYYINNRDECLGKFASRDIGKTAYLVATNKDKMCRNTENPQHFKDYDKEMKKIQKKLINLTNYKDLFDTVPEDKRDNNYNGCAVNRILCFYENIILQHAIHIINKNQLEIAILMFDGCQIYGNHYQNTELLDEITNYVDTEMPDLNMSWTYKEHNMTLCVPDDFDETIVNASPDNKEKSFENVALQFELNHLKIINKAFFIKEFENKIIILNDKQLKSAYSHLVYEKEQDTKDGVKTITKGFISDWLDSNPKQNRKDDIGIYPTGLECPENYYNLWRPFQMELVTEYVEMKDELFTILEHIKILCGNDEVVYDYFIKWISQMIQYPAIKSICPTLISKEGAGKGTLMRLLCKMLGDEKVFETTTPSRDVWGDFNAQMANTFLVNLNELSKKETMETEGQIKGLITDPKLTINNKGVQKYQIQSFHRFLITTNNEEPINTKQGDRRNLIIRSSDEKCGDKEYFNVLYTLIDDVNVVKTCYEYFKSVPNMDKFSTIPMPLTTYQSDLQEMKVSPIESWIKSVASEYYNNTTVEKLSADWFKKFLKWLEKCKIDYKLTIQAFGVRLKRLNILHVTQGLHTNKGNVLIFDIVGLKKLFNIGCLISVPVDDDCESESDD